MKISLILVFMVIVISGCNSTPQSPYDSYRPATPIKPTFIDTDIVQKIDLLQNLQNPSENTNRAFIGLKTRDCKKIGKVGSYVIGFFFLNGKSPAKEYGILEGDEIVEINNDRINITSNKLGEFISRVPPKLFYKFKVIRNNTIRMFEVKSASRIIGSDILTKTSARTCKDNYSLGLEDLN